MHILPLRAPRTANRIVMFCTAINDHTSWPFWKYLQMKKIKGVTDLIMLAITTESGTFEARIDGTDYTLKNMENLKTYRPEVLEQFLDRWHIPGHTYFVYGGHGMGDFLELEQFVTPLQCHELASIMGKKQYQGVLFDACFMSNLDCAYHLRNNTKYIGASEGYMWEDDTALDKHIFNTYTASAMSRFKDPLAIFQAIQRDYMSKTNRGDFAVLDTTHSEALHAYCQKHVIPRIYDRVNFFTDAQQEALEELACEAMGADADNFGNELNAPHGGGGEVEGVVSGKLNKKSAQLKKAVQYEHSLYPAEIEDKHILDLFQYLVDIAREEQMAASAPHHHLGDGNGPAEPLLVLPSRTLDAANQGRIPADQIVNATNSPITAGLTPTPIRLSEGLELFNKVVVSHAPPHDESVYATRLGGLSIVAPELSAHSKPLVRTNYHRAAFKKKAAEFLAKQKGAKRDKAERERAAAAAPATPEAAAAVETPAAATAASSSDATHKEKKIAEKKESPAAPDTSAVAATATTTDMSPSTVEKVKKVVAEKERAPVVPCSASTCDYVKASTTASSNPTTAASPEATDASK